MSTVLLSTLRPALIDEQDRWLRRRFVLYCAILASASALLTVALALGVTSTEDSSAQLYLRMNLALAMVCVLIYAAPLVYMVSRPRRLSRRAVLRLSYGVTLAFAAVYILPSMALAALVTRAWREAGNPNASIGPLAPWFLGFFASHFLASLIIPWRPREAALSYLPVAIIMSAITLVGVNDPWNTRLIGVAALLGVGLPGVLVCWVRHTRFARRFHLTALSEHFEETSRELTDAQRLHHALLPSPTDDGDVSLTFAYEPMRAIGGDFLYVHDMCTGDVRSITFVLVDVTGHGIPAALTVHRLHGELERIFGERPDANPALVLSQLNRYFHVALSKHSVYATALCAQVALSSNEPPRLTYASAGHPPALRIGSAQASEKLESTSFVLGAVGPDDFDPDPRTLTLKPGDVVVAYTDGAFECRDDRGEMLGLDALSTIVTDNASASDAPQAILNAVREARRRTPPNDDTLIVTVRIPSPSARPEHA